MFACLGNSIAEGKMLKDVVLPTIAEEFCNAAEILRELASQLHFHETQNHFMALASILEQQAGLRERTPD